MKSKGPVDFFLGVFLEFGVAFCLLFFMPQIPWDRLSRGTEQGSTASTSLPLANIAAPDRRVLLRPAPPSEFGSHLSQAAERTRSAPALLPTDLERAIVPLPAAPIAANIPSQPPPPELRRDFPRQYRY